MKETNKVTTAPALLRWGICFLATLLTFLLIWLLGFLLRDIGNLKGPDFSEISRSHVNPALTERSTALEKQISEIDVQVGRQREIQQNLQQSMNNARETMQQMMNLHRLSLSKSDPQRHRTRGIGHRSKTSTPRDGSSRPTGDQQIQPNRTISARLKSVRSQIEDQHQPAREFDRLSGATGSRSLR